ncbi:unnamed protein product [Polarella glacialis]|uniref:Uncharacterized protein n=1 Tax=Polarella glacialis TaxID=89957 RepID=A0A813FNJ5_POLGL|nr:unnamed protein product [Polarella glacialis]
MGFLDGWTAQLIEWRRIDDMVARQLKDDVKELKEQNGSLQQFLMEYVTSQEFSMFRQSINDYSRLVNELSSTAGGRNGSTLLRGVETIVEATIAKSLSSLTHELHVSSNQRSSVSEAKHEARGLDVAQRLDDLAARVSQNTQAVSLQDDFIRDRLEEVFKGIGDRVETSMRWTAGEIAQSTMKACQESAESMRVISTADRLMLQEEITRLISGADDADDADETVGGSQEEQAQPTHESDKRPKRRPSLKAQLQEAKKAPENVQSMLRQFSRRLEEGVASHAQAENWRNIFSETKISLDTTSADLARCETGAKEAQVMLEKAEGELKLCSSGLLEAQAKLQGPIEWGRYIQCVDAVVKRGRLTVSLQDQEIELIQGMNFLPRKPSEGPAAEWQDLAAAEEALADLLELLKGSFAGLPLTIESHAKTVKGPAPFWESIATNRALFLRDALEQKGIPGQLLKSAVGFYGNKGLDRPCIKIKIALFPVKEDLSSKASPRGKSPGGKKK